MLITSRYLLPTCLHVGDLCYKVRSQVEMTTSTLRIVLSIDDKLYYFGSHFLLPPCSSCGSARCILKSLGQPHTAWVKQLSRSFSTTRDFQPWLNRKKGHQLAPKFPYHPRGKIPPKVLNLYECGSRDIGRGTVSVLSPSLLKSKRTQPLELGGGKAIFGLRASRKLKPGALSLYVGNGQREAVEAIGNFDLSLPSGLVIVLNNCHYAPSITRGVISVSRLYEDGFINRFVNNTIQVSRNNMVYFSAIPRDGIFEIDLSNSLQMKIILYTVSNKRAKLDLDSALLWQLDGNENLTNLKWKGPKTYLVNTQPIRYGYVYLLKHKHEVFETFKVFQKEVENQLGKTIKSLRSDRGGEYMSQEFLDHLKDHGIIAHRTPPYTPQHNGVSERRNRTLLDMVRSMMSQTTLPKSFWDYALETVARILNMVPTKKVEKTPYECIFIGYPRNNGIFFLLPTREQSPCCSNAEFLENSLIDQEAIPPDLGEPALTYKAALLDPESDKWLNVMNVEMQSMKDNEVWILVELPPNGKTVGSKWLLKAQKDEMDVAVQTYKVAHSAFYDYEIWQMDVKMPSSMDISLKRFTWSNLKSSAGYGVLFLNGGAVDWKRASKAFSLLHLQK
ncbi:retrotransposon protein, putative, ty1-copia subclass [Tanacetum coccineum]